MTIFIILAIVAAVFLWGIGVQRKLVNADEICSNSMSQIGVQQNSRWDALSALADLVKGYSEHEYKTLMAVISQRASIGRSSSVADANSQETKFEAALKQVNLVAEQYPDLKANTTYVEAMKSVNQYENQVRMSRMVFNDAVTKFNRIVRMFPDSLVASMLHFQVKDYLAEPQGKTEMPSFK